MKMFLILVPMFLLVSCSSALYTEVDRSKLVKEEVYQTNLPALKAYKATLVGIAKSLGDAKEAIQIKDEQDLRIVFDTIVYCEEIVPAMLRLGTTTKVKYGIDVQFKDQKARAVITPKLVITINDSVGVQESGVFTESMIEDMKGCTLKVSDLLKNSLKDDSSNNTKDW